MRYCAFISYSHADEAWARWLMRRLETYRVPARLVGSEGAYGPIGPRLGAFFRDRDELTASGDLAATIDAALEKADALVVICSPAAARSRWVDAEIKAFRASGRGERVLSFVVAGEPGCQHQSDGCFPPALLAPDADGRAVEPLAADARPEGDGRERAFLKLVAGILGIGFDALAQRDAQRRQRRLAAIAVASLAGMALALALAATAVVARNDAQRRQVQAEDILGFMLGDLREKLSTVGRLDLMRSVDDKAAGYFATLDPRDLTDRALEEQARSLTGIGQVRLDEGNHDEAMAAFREAHSRSTALHERAPDNGQRLFDLAQAEYWIGFVAWQQGRLDDAEVWLRRYRDSAVELAAMDRGNFDWQKEVAYGYQNLAVLDESRGRYAEAERAMLAQLQLYRGWSKQRPRDFELGFQAANAASWLGSLALQQGRLAQAETYFQEQVTAIRKNVSEDPDNAKWRENSVDALLLLTSAQASRGRRDESMASLQAASSIAVALHAQDPANNEWRILLATCLLWQANLNALQEPERALSAASAATSLLKEAHAIEPSHERLLNGLARAHWLQAQMALAGDDESAARMHLSMARAVVEPAWQARQSERLRSTWASILLLEGEVAQRQGDLAAARHAWSDSRRLLLEDPTTPLAFDRLEPLVRTLHHLGETAEVRTYRQRLDKAGFVPLHPWPPLTALARAD